MEWREGARRCAAAWSALRAYGPTRAVARASWRLRERLIYQSWIARRRPPVVTAGAMGAETPLVSVLMPTFEPEPAWLLKAMESVRAQSYSRWELCVADDASTGRGALDALAALAGSDSRVRVRRRGERGHISAASNTALSMARGELVALLDQDDELAPDALRRVVEEFQRHPETDVIYTDEDKVDPAGRRYDPYFKPDFSPDLLLSQNLVSHLGVYRASRVREVGGFREGFEGSQDHDLVIRLMERPGTRAHHVTEVLYHWRAVPHSTAAGPDRKGYAARSGLRAIQSHLDRLGRRAAAEPALASYYRVRWGLPDPPRRVDLIAVAPVGEPAEATARLDVRRHVVDPREGEGGRAALLNEAARGSRGDMLVFLGPGCVLGAGDLEELVSQALRPEVGVAGGKVVTSRGRVRHAGYLISLEESPVVLDAHAGLHPDEPGHFGRNLLAQNFSAVSADAMALRREVFDEVSGFDADAFPQALFDVDLGLRIWSRGLRVVWTPWARAVVPATLNPRVLTRGGREESLLRERWGARVARDPYWHPALDRRRPDFRIERPGA